MRLKVRYKSCLWSRANIWGNLLMKKKNFLRPKWDTIMGILFRQRPRRHSKNYKGYRHRICHDYKYLQPRTRANQVFKYNRFGYRNTLSVLLCLKRFYGDLSHKSFKKFCKPAFSIKEPSQTLLGFLEGRLDISLCRLHFFHSIYLSRQAILHEKVLVNGEITKNGGLILKKGDLVEFCPEYRPVIKARMFARLKRSRRVKTKASRARLSLRTKLMTQLHPIPNWIQTDYSNLSFMLSSNACSPVIYPFRANIDEALWAAKYGYL